MQRCVVIGAGIVGAALAARLAEQHAVVTVVEANQPGHGTSGSSLAWVNANDKPPRAYHDLNAAGLRAWRQWAEQLGGSWFCSGGSLHWAEPEGAAALAQHVALLTDWGYPAQLLTTTQALELEPELAIPSAVSDVAYFPEEAYLHPVPTIWTLLDYATTRGATLLTGDAVVSFLVTGNRVHGVRLASGEHLEANTVALCAGWRTPSLAAQLGLAIPIEPVDAPGSSAACLVAYSDPTPTRLSRFLSTPGLDLRPAENGRLLFGSGDIDADIDLTTNSALVEAHALTLLARAHEILPATLAGAALADYRVCIRPLPIDGVSIVGRPTGLEGCYVIVTHSGVTLAAHLATLAAAEILTGSEQQVLSPYRLQRFAAGAGRATGPAPLARH